MQEGKEAFKIAMSVKQTNVLSWPYQNIFIEAFFAETRNVWFSFTLELCHNHLFQAMFDICQVISSWILYLICVSRLREIAMKTLFIFHYTAINWEHDLLSLLKETNLSKGLRFSQYVPIGGACWNKIACLK